MDLLDIVSRTPVAHPWEEGEKIPWHEPGFSRRMLAEHLSQAHDAASRRSATIDTHVAWIHQTVLASRPSRILDLGCGPGLYTVQLARLGHACVGIDFSPASIEHAIATATGADCSYHLADIREAEFGDGFDLVMLIFGEFNVFRPSDAAAILAKARWALAGGGRLLLEVHTSAAIQRIGTAEPAWRAVSHGLFSDRPHLRLDESAWDDDLRVATERYFVIDAETASVSRYAQSMQAYTDDEYCELLRQAGFTLNGIYPSLTGEQDGGDFFVITGLVT